MLYDCPDFPRQFNAITAPPRRDKIGFQTHEKAWLFAIADTVRGWLADDIGVPFFDQAAVVREFEAILAGRQAFSWQVWRWINFIRWHQQFLS